MQLPKNLNIPYSLKIVVNKTKRAFSWSISILHISLIECSYQRLPHCWVLATLFPQLITEALMSPYTELTRHTLIGFCCHKDTSEWCLANGHWPPISEYTISWELFGNVSTCGLCIFGRQMRHHPLGRACPEILIRIFAVYHLPWQGVGVGGVGSGVTNYFSKCVKLPPKKMLSFPGLAGKFLSVESQQATSPGTAANPPVAGTCPDPQHSELRQ